MLLPLLTYAQGGRTHKKQQQPKEPQVRNVIFVVGDGMGVAQVYASVVAQRADNSVFLRFPYSGFSRTYSHNRYTTDSGAGGSALMTGHKVENYHIALGPDGTAYPVPSVSGTAVPSHSTVSPSSWVSYSPEAFLVNSVQVPDADSFPVAGS